jgi:mycothiol synthase
LFFVESNYIHDMRPVFKRTPWRIDPEQPQNAIFGGGVHPVDLAQWVAGEVEEVFAYGNHKTVPEYHSADNILISLKFKNGCVGKIWITFGLRRRPAHVVDLNVFGSEGTIYTNTEQAEARLYLPELMLGEAEDQSGWTTIPLKTVKGHPFLAELAAFVEAIQTGRKPMVDVEDGARTVAVLEAAQQSLELGQPVQVEGIGRPLTAVEQLLMRRPHLEALDDLALPAGYQLRTFQPGDEQTWLELCNPAIGMNWSMEQLHQKLLDVPWFSPDRLFFITHNQEPVGTACAWQLTVDEKHTGYVHMVVVQPEHRGRGLGRAATLRVLHYFREHGFKESVLNTDDFRLPAIMVYRLLGFEPVIQDEIMRQRWGAVETILGVSK